MSELNPPVWRRASLGQWTRVITFKERISRRQGPNRRAWAARLHFPGARAFHGPSVKCRRVQMRNDGKGSAARVVNRIKMPASSRIGQELGPGRGGETLFF